MAAAVGAGAAAPAGLALPVATERPMDIDFARDPVLGLRTHQADRAYFESVIDYTVRNHPATAESVANEDEAGVRVDQERAGFLPTVDVNVSTYKIISRKFSNDPDNIIERSRANQRTDAQLSIQQMLVDFGATYRRYLAAKSREAGAGADVEGTAGRVALGTIDAWLDVFSYRALTALSTDFVTRQKALRAGIQQRIREGASAEADMARVDSSVSEAIIRQATSERQLANAEARYRELVGAPAPAELGRAPVPNVGVQSREDAVIAADGSADVRSALATADASHRDFSASRASKLPNFTAGVDAGRYGVLENKSDYDIRARVTMKQRLFGGTDPRSEQYAARARAADARANRVKAEAERDAAIAWADVKALERQLDALQEAYAAARRSRDVVTTRFHAARGSLLDVLGSEEGYFGSAVAYIQGLTELDAARYALLSKTGGLLTELKIEPKTLGSAR